MKKNNSLQQMYPHELRTPVTVIISQGEYLIEDPVLEEEEKEEIMIILRQARRMSEIDQ